MSKNEPAAALSLLIALFLAGRTAPAAVAGSAFPVPLPTSDLVAHTCIMFNKQVAESRELAFEYAELRGIDKDRIFGVAGGVREGISRSSFEKFVRRPFLRYAQEEGWMEFEKGEDDRVTATRNDVWILCLMRGMPLRVERSNLAAKDRPGGKEPRMKGIASVDSELAAAPLFEYPLGEALTNPFYRKRGSINSQWSRLLILVTRIDGPEPDDARRLMKDAITVEKTGLAGRAYIDSRGIKNGGYMRGDNWLRGARDHLVEAGFEVEFDSRGALFEPTYPMTDTAFYAGWYSQPGGPFLREGGFRFLPGAIAYHIISNSGYTIRPKFQATNSWIITFVRTGAACTMGAVHEPFLGHTTNVDLFTENLLAGYTFAEAAYHATPTLSWMMTMIGDPLYRPFPLDPNSQLEALREAGKPVIHAAIRNLNLLFRSGGEEEATDLARQLADQEGDLRYREKEAQFLFDRGEYREAGTVWERVVSETSDPDQLRRVLRRLWVVGEALEEGAVQYSALDRYSLRFPEDNLGESLTRQMRDLAREHGTPQRLQWYQERLDQIHRDAEAKKG